MAIENNWWTLSLEHGELSDLTDTDREHIAQQIIDGMREGQIVGTGTHEYYFVVRADTRQVVHQVHADKMEESFQYVQNATFTEKEHGRFEIHSFTFEEEMPECLGMDLEDIENLKLEGSEITEDYHRWYVNVTEDYNIKMKPHDIREVVMMLLEGIPDDQIADKVL